MAHVSMLQQSDVLFPEPQGPPATINDSFYSVHSTQTASSAYSTYSQEVKYIFEPRTRDLGVSCSAVSWKNLQNGGASQPGPNVMETGKAAWNHVARDANENLRPSELRNVSMQTINLNHVPWMNSSASSHTSHVDFGTVPSEAGCRAPINMVEETYTPPHRGIRQQPSSHPSQTHYTCRSMDARRRTWSPPAFERALKMVPNFPLRCYRSNDQLDVTEGENLYEELDNLPGRGRMPSVMSPPRIAPVSGRLHQTVKPPLIKPVAFKPVQSAGTPMRYVATPPGPAPMRACPRTPQPPSEGYVSQTSPATSHGTTTVNRSPNSYRADSITYAEFIPKSLESGPGINHGRYSSGHSEGFVGTPSPSDSGVGELENMLRDKDAEITHLRTTLEQNETAILRVYEEKRQAWAAELKEAGGEWEKALRNQQQRALKMEQALLLQLFRLQQDRKTLRTDVEQLRTENTAAQQKIEEMKSEQVQLQHKLDKQTTDQTSLSSKLEETQWDLCQKVGEISLLKSQLKDGQDGTTNKNNELLGLKNQLRDLTLANQKKDAEREQLKKQLETANQEVSRRTTETECLRKEVEQCRKSHGLNLNCVPMNNSREENDKLRSELLQIRSELEKHLEHYASEKDQWLEEKNKVIRYQKHLQLNYVQMYRKNKLLEKEVEQLMVEIENKDLKLMAEEEGQLGQESTC